MLNLSAYFFLMTKQLSFLVNTLKNQKLSLIFILFSLLGYWSFAYDLVRSDSVKLFMLYAALFFVAFKLIQSHKNNFWLLASLALIFRLDFLLATPNLSQDFFRFIWDGRLLAHGLNPFLSTPNDLATSSKTIIPQAQTLIDGMGNLSAGNHSNYPPISQLVFWLAGIFTGKSIFGSIILIRMILILADLGTLYYGKKLLQKLNLPVHRIFWFILNPFVIIELTGNLHFEGLMIFFLIASLYYLVQKKWFLSAVFMGLSISTKLIPLMLLPVLFYFFTKTKQLGFWKLMGFYVISLGILILGFLPFLSQTAIQNYSGATSLWFQKFEFNASIYYVIRWIGFQVKGWNIIETVGKVLPAITVVFILGLAFFRRNLSPKILLTSMLFAVCFYFLLSTTVHPWYLATPLVLCLFTRFRFSIVWSLMVIVSYSAYGKHNFNENLWWVALEYIVVIGFFVWEMKSRPHVKYLKDGS